MRDDYFDIIKKRDSYLSYLTSIEDDFLRIRKYVDFTEDNEGTYSIEFAKMIMTCCQEIDTLMKDICLFFGNSTANNIATYSEVLQEKIPYLISSGVWFHRFETSTHPWEDWNSKNSPIWWQANNKIKHNRTKHFKHANFKNAYYSYCGLYVLLISYLIVLERELYGVQYSDVDYFLKGKGYYPTLVKFNNTFTFDENGLLVEKDEPF